MGFAGEGFEAVGVDGGRGEGEAVSAGGGGDGVGVAEGFAESGDEGLERVGGAVWWLFVPEGVGEGGGGDGLVGVEGEAGEEGSESGASDGDGCAVGVDLEGAEDADGEVYGVQCGVAVGPGCGGGGPSRPGPLVLWRCY